MKRYVFLAVVFALLWVLFSGYWHVFPLIPGIVGLVCLLYLMARFDYVAGTLKYTFTIKILAMLAYIPWLFLEVLKSNVAMVRYCFFGGISPALLALDIPTKTPQGLSILCISITLTPGTFIMGVSDDKIYVHCLVTPEEGIYFNTVMNAHVVALEVG